VAGDVAGTEENEAGMVVGVSGRGFLVESAANGESCEWGKVGRNHPAVAAGEK